MYLNATNAKSVNFNLEQPVEADVGSRGIKTRLPSNLNKKFHSLNALPITNKCSSLGDSDIKKLTVYKTRTPKKISSKGVRRPSTTTASNESLLVKGSKNEINHSVFEAKPRSASASHRVKRYSRSHDNVGIASEVINSKKGNISSILEATQPVIVKRTVKPALELPPWNKSTRVIVINEKIEDTYTKLMR
jgi:hypothetical protein